ncbi:hypothetical protein MRX96_030779 [Rhipicephalus microplus]
MAVRTNLDGVETLLTPILGEDGGRIPQGDGFAYSTTEPELWSGRKTRFLINKYKKLKDLVSKKGGFRTKKALWQTLAKMISREFESPCSPRQIQNKWKGLKWAYKRTK